MKTEVEISPKLKYNNQIAEATAHALKDGAHGLKALPGLLKIMLNPEKQCWKARYVHQLRDIVRFDSFEEYVKSNPPEGLGSDIKILRRLCADDLEALDALERAVQGKRGGDHGNQYTCGKDDNVIFATSNKGNSLDYALRRLRKDRPDLHKQVIEKKLSANAAMVKAGLRPKTITVPINVEKAARALVKSFGDDALALVEAIKNLLD